jgi:hypothetical protein
VINQIVPIFSGGGTKLSAHIGILDAIHTTGFSKFSPPHYLEDEFASEPWYSIAKRLLWDYLYMESTSLAPSPDERG